MTAEGSVVAVGTIVRPGDLTANGDVIVAVHDSDEGDCGYCGEMIYSQVAVTEGGMKQAISPGLALRYYANPDQPGVFEAGRFEKWHTDCIKWMMRWVQNPNGTTHLATCRYADKDGTPFQATRGEARHAFGGRFCEKCAPIDAWFVAEPFAYPEVTWPTIDVFRDLLDAIDREQMGSDGGTYVKLDRIGEALNRARRVLTEERCESAAR